MGNIELGYKITKHANKQTSNNQSHYNYNSIKHLLLMATIIVNNTNVIYVKI